MQTRGGCKKEEEQKKTKLDVLIRSQKDLFNTVDILFKGVNVNVVKLYLDEDMHCNAK